MLINTSGSTRTPKSVVISLNSVVHHVNYMSRKFKLNKETIELVSLPISSTAVLFSQLLPVAISQGTLKINQIPFNIPDLMQNLSNSYDFMGITPTILRILDKVGYNWRSVGVKAVAVGGEKIDFEHLKHINGLINREAFFPMYGLTETLGVFCMGGPNDKACPPGSVGKACPEWNIRIMKDELQVKSQYNTSL
ncbi:AMP-binding protein [Lactobacillus sp. DCY120]|uniref:AMP-binding protein n=2 Tax=Bombilactobacillus apium TaxID=2675299 RepID=A0A850QYS8_9LACO|nr:AMP-binding protein [Bombilactobacillus apium]